MDYKKKVIACLLLIIALFSVPFAQTTQATDGGAGWYKYFQDVIVRAAAQTAFKALSNRILNKIQSGGLDGAPAFVQNWIEFETKAEHRGEGIFRAELTQSHLCGYFSNSIKSLFGVRPDKDNIILSGHNVRTGSTENYDLRTNCTLPGNFKIADYQKDFAGNGGWQALSRILEPQNNYYGVLFASLDEIAQQRGLSKSADINNAVAGKGFTGLLSGPNGCTLRGKGPECLIEGKIKTPGSTLGDAASDATSKGTTAMLAAADGASIAISALTDWAINKLFDSGLSGSTNDNTDVSTTASRSAESYTQEYCTASDNISKEAGLYVREHYPQAYGPLNFDLEKNTGSLNQIDPKSRKRWRDIIGSSSFPLEHTLLCDNDHDACGRSFCNFSTQDNVGPKHGIGFNYHTENTYPYSRCSQACLKAVGEAPSLAAPTFTVPLHQTDEGGLTCADVPTATACTASNQVGSVQKVANFVSAKGIYTLAPDANWCGKLEIVKRVACAAGAGLLVSYHSSSCNGIDGRYIAYPDNSAVKILNDSGPIWSPDTPSTDSGIHYTPATGCPIDPAGSY